MILNCCESGTPKETIEKLLHRMSEERTLTAESLVKVLKAVKMAFPDLGLLLENLQKLATLPSTTGIVNCWLSGLEPRLQKIIA